MKQFATYDAPNNSRKILVYYTTDRYVKFNSYYSEISGTYLGLECISFVDAIHNILKIQDDFFDKIDTPDHETALINMGFEKIPMPAAEKQYFDLIYRM